MSSLDGTSYLMGVLSGMILKWTDIIPIMGGFLLGLSVKQLPQLIKYEDLPQPVKNMLNKTNNLFLWQDDIETLEMEDMIPVASRTRGRGRGKKIIKVKE